MHRAHFPPPSDPRSRAGRGGGGGPGHGNSVVSNFCYGNNVPRAGAGAGKGGHHQLHHVTNNGTILHQQSDPMTSSTFPPQWQFSSPLESGGWQGSFQDHGGFGPDPMSGGARSRPAVQPYAKGEDAHWMRPGSGFGYAALQASYGSPEYCLIADEFVDPRLNFGQPYGPGVMAQSYNTFADSHPVSSVDTNFGYYTDYYSAPAPPAPPGNPAVHPRAARSAGEHYGTPALPSNPAHDQAAQYYHYNGGGGPGGSRSGRLETITTRIGNTVSGRGRCAPVQPMVASTPLPLLEEAGGTTARIPAPAGSRPLQPSSPEGEPHMKKLLLQKLGAESEGVPSKNATSVQPAAEAGTTSDAEAGAAAMMKGELLKQELFEKLQAEAQAVGEKRSGTRVADDNKTGAADDCNTKSDDHHLHDGHDHNPAAKTSVAHAVASKRQNASSKGTPEAVNLNLNPDASRLLETFFCPEMLPGAPDQDAQDQSFGSACAVEQLGVSTFSSPGIAAAQDGGIAPAQRDPSPPPCRQVLSPEPRVFADADPSAECWTDADPDTAYIIETYRKGWNYTRAAGAGGRCFPSAPVPIGGSCAGAGTKSKGTTTSNTENRPEPPALAPQPWERSAGASGSSRSSSSAWTSGSSYPGSGPPQERKKTALQDEDFPLSASWGRLPPESTPEPGFRQANKSILQGPSCAEGGDQAQDTAEAVTGALSRTAESQPPDAALLVTAKPHDHESGEDMNKVQFPPSPSDRSGVGVPSDLTKTPTEPRYTEAEWAQYYLEVDGFDFSNARILVEQGSGSDHRKTALEEDGGAFLENPELRAAMDFLKKEIFDAWWYNDRRQRPNKFIEQVEVYGGVTNGFYTAGDFGGSNGGFFGAGDCDVSVHCPALNLERLKSLDAVREKVRELLWDFRCEMQRVNAKYHWSGLPQPVPEHFVQCKARIPLLKCKLRLGEKFYQERGERERAAKESEDERMLDWRESPEKGDWAVAGPVSGGGRRDGVVGSGCKRLQNKSNRNQGDHYFYNYVPPLNERGIDFDITVNNAMAVRNSKLLRAYSSNPICERLGKLVKIWAKSRGFVGVQNGYLSSYGWVLTVIWFLQNQGILPNLQEAPWGHEFAAEDGGQLGGSSGSLGGSRGSWSGSWGSSNSNGHNDRNKYDHGNRGRYGSGYGGSWSDNSSWSSWGGNENYSWQQRNNWKPHVLRLAEGFDAPREWKTQFDEKWRAPKLRPGSGRNGRGRAEELCVLRLWLGFLQFWASPGQCGSGKRQLRPFRRLPFSQLENGSYTEEVLRTYGLRSGASLADRETNVHEASTTPAYNSGSHTTSASAAPGMKPSYHDCRFLACGHPFDLRAQLIQIGKNTPMPKAQTVEDMVRQCWNRWESHQHKPNSDWFTMSPKDIDGAWVRSSVGLLIQDPFVLSRFLHLENSKLAEVRSAMQEEFDRTLSHQGGGGGARRRSSSAEVVGGPAPAVTRSGATTGVIASAGKEALDARPDESEAGDLENQQTSGARREDDLVRPQQEVELELSHLSAEAAAVAEIVAEEEERIAAEQHERLRLQEFYQLYNDIERHNNEDEAEDLSSLQMQNQHAHTVEQRAASSSTTNQHSTAAIRKDSTGVDERLQGGRNPLRKTAIQATPGADAGGSVKCNSTSSHSPLTVILHEENSGSNNHDDGAPFLSITASSSTSSLEVLHRNAELIRTGRESRGRTRSPSIELVVDDEGGHGIQQQTESMREKVRASSQHERKLTTTTVPRKAKERDMPSDVGFLYPLGAGGTRAEGPAGKLPRGPSGRDRGKSPEDALHQKRDGWSLQQGGSITNSSSSSSSSHGSYTSRRNQGQQEVEFSSRREVRDHASSAHDKNDGGGWDFVRKIDQMSLQSPGNQGGTGGVGSVQGARRQLDAWEDSSPKILHKAQAILRKANGAGKHGAAVQRSSGHHAPAPSFSAGLAGSTGGASISCRAGNSRARGKVGFASADCEPAPGSEHTSCSLQAEQGQEATVRRAQAPQRAQLPATMALDQMNDGAASHPHPVVSAYSHNYTLRPRPAALILRAAASRHDERPPGNFFESVIAARGPQPHPPRAQVETRNGESIVEARSAQHDRDVRMEAIRSERARGNRFCN